MKKKQKAVVIGAGISGLACAIRLVKKGYEVIVHEANPYPGGKLSEFKLGKYRFDAGPSLFTMPKYVDELFELHDEDPKEHFQYISLEVPCHYFYDDGTSFQSNTNTALFADAVHKATGEPKKHIHSALKNSSFLYETLSELFVHRPLNKFSTYFNKKAFRAYLRIPRLDFFRTMDQKNKRLFNDPKLVQLFNRYATYNGSDPYQTPATMNIIPHLEYNIGTYFPTDGMHQITSSMYELATRQGVSFVFNRKVDRILMEGKKVTGIQSNGKDEPADLVVCNMDMVSAYHKLLPKKITPKKLVSQPKSSSALIFYWGVKRTFTELGLHNIFFSSDYKAEFEHIFNKKTVYIDPTVYINITSKHKKDDAPAGCENWFVMVNVPPNEGQRWQELIPQIKANVINKLNKNLNIDLEELIEEEDFLDPERIEVRTSSWQGALYGNSSNNKFSAFLRHQNRSPHFSNLYFCGGSVHPGGGIPLCLSSAKITAGLIPDAK